MVGEAKRELRETDLALRVLIDGTSDVIYLKDRLGRYVFVNAACARLLRMTAESAIGKNDIELFGTDEARLMYEMDQAVLRTCQPQTFEESLSRTEGTRIFHTTKTPYYGPTGDVIGVIGVSRDITESKAQELANAQLVAIVNSSVDAILAKKLDGTITCWNAAAERMFGYSCEEAVGRSVGMLMTPELQKQVAKLHGRLCGGEAIESYEMIGCRKDGTRSPIAVALSPIRDLRGTVVGTSMIARDVTERKQIEKELRESEERQRLAVEAAHLGVWCWRVHEDRLVWTPQCSSMHGLGPDEEVTYERLLAMLHPEDRESTERAVRRALEGCASCQIEHRVVWPDGSIHWLSTSARVLCNDAGVPDRMLGVTFDITAQKQTDQERAELLRREQAARAEAQSATRAKDEFLAVLSHELRTPLQSMLGWTQLLRAPGADARMVQRGMEVMERNIKLQTRLIEDLLDVSRIVAGKLRLAQERVDLGAVVASALASVKAAADAKSIQSDATLEPLAVDVLGDPARLEQVVANLLSNALKFTSKGGRIELGLAREGTSARLTVKDTGAGISPQFLPQVFERFRQAESTLKRAHGGLGLGLAIVRHLIELHGGTVSAESPGEGQGSTFTVTLPLLDSDDRDILTWPNQLRQNEPGPPVTLEDIRVVVVDDEADTREMLETVLRASGAEVHAVHSARAALEAIAYFHPHVVISDVGMPEKDGYDLIDELRAQEVATGSHLPAVALTAFTSQTDREHALAVGFDAHLAKPASPDDVVHVVANLVGRPA